MVTTTTEAASGAAQLRLLTWLSPAFPVGSFSYSHGLESAVDEGLLAGPDGLRDWLETMLDMGSGWNDAVIFAETWRRAQSGGDLSELADLAEALAGSAERHMESTLQGAAFLVAASGWPHPIIQTLPPQTPYPVAVGGVTGAHGVSLEPALAAYLQAFASNLVQAAVRLGVTGQTGAMAIVASLEPVVIRVAARAAQSTLDDLGSVTVLFDIAAMRHETQHSRLFRS